MRAIDADALMEWAVNIGRDGRWGISLDDLTDAIEDAHTIDPVVRCKDCKHRPTFPKDSHYRGVFDLEFPDDICPLQCGDPWYNREPDDDWFCPNGEEKGR